MHTRRALLPDGDVRQLHALLLSRRELVQAGLRRTIPAFAARLFLRPLEGAPAVLEGPARPDVEAHGPARGREARLGQRDGLGEDRARPRNLLGARGPVLALVQRHDRDTGLRAAHVDGARPLRPAAPRDRAVALLEQEAKPVEVHARDGRGHLRARQVLEEGRSARDSRGRDGDRGWTEDLIRFRARPLYGEMNQVVVPGGKLDPKTASTIVVEKESKGLAFASATWHFSTEKLPEENRGDFFSVSRKYFKREASPSGFVLKPLAEGAAIAPGDEVEIQISLSSQHEAEYVHLRDPRAAGCEPERAVSRYRWELGIGWYEEIRDSGTNFFFERLHAGQYTFKYRLRANMAGVFRVGPATVQSMYAPEFAAYSAGAVLTIK